LKAQKNLGTLLLNAPIWLRFWQKAKVTPKFQQVSRLLTVEIVVLKHTFDSDS